MAHSFLKGALKNTMKKRHVSAVLGRIVISAILIFLLFYFMLPPINFKSQDFIIFLILSILILLTVNFVSYMKEFLSGLTNSNLRLERDPFSGQIRFGMQRADEAAGHGRSLAKPLKYGFALIGVLVLFMMLASLVGIQFFNAKRYRDLIITENGDFSADVAEISMNQIPVVDRDTATRLGSRKLGEMSELVSQFEIENDYTQINYQGTPYRVTPLTYADPIKWFYNQKSGLPAYITVNMVSQQTDLVWLENGMKYSPGEYFFRNIYRHIRFLYPTKI